MPMIMVKTQKKAAVQARRRMAMLSKEERRSTAIEAPTA